MPSGTTPHINLPYRRLRTSRLVGVSSGGGGAHGGVGPRAPLRMAHPLLPHEGNRVTMSGREESRLTKRRRRGDKGTRLPPGASAFFPPTPPLVAYQSEAWPPGGPLQLNLPCCRLRTSRLRSG